MRNKKGFILVLVLVGLFILTIAGMSSIYIFGIHKVFITEDKTVARALYLAEMGLERAKKDLEDKKYFPELFYGNSNPYWPFAGGASGVVPNASVPGEKFYVTITPFTENTNTSSEIYPSNFIHITAPSVLDTSVSSVGNYLIVSTGAVVGPTSTSTKAIKTVLRIRFEPLSSPPTYYYKIVANSWQELPLRRQ